jgi:hypothetical protein
MTSTIAIEEPRTVKDKFRDWYQTKMINTNKAQDFEAFIDKKIAVEKKVIQIVGTIATVALIFIPADGPYGEICAALATPILAKLVELKGELEKKVILISKRAIEANFLGVDGTNKSIELPEGNIVKTVTGITENIALFADEVGGPKK